MLAEFLYPLNSFVEVEALLDKARNRLDAGDKSKFEKLREVLRDPSYIDEKHIIFTEHRDTADFLVRRLEGLGFTGQVALIHGGLPYQERERQVEFFRRPANEGGASYLVATDAAGEVRRLLTHLNDEAEQETFRRLLPVYVRLAKLLVRSRDSVAYTITPSAAIEAAE